MNRRDHEYTLASSHARGLAEEMNEHPHDRRLRLIREIAESMKRYVIPVATGQKYEELVF